MALYRLLGTVAALKVADCWCRRLPEGLLSEWRCLMPMEALQRRLAEMSEKDTGYLDTIKEWQSGVKELCRTVEEIVQPLRHADQLRVDRRTDDVTEDGLGSYTVDGLDLRFADIPGAVQLRAKSARVVGIRMPNGAWRTQVQGRVDLERGAIRVPLTRDRAAGLKWKIASGGELRPVSDDALQAALTLLLGLK